MTLLYKPTALLKIAFVAIFNLFLFSCNSVTDIGLDTLPANDRQGLTYIDTSLVVTGNLLRDSIITSSKGAFCVGSYNDPIFGKLKATGYMELKPNASLSGFPDGVTYDSMTVQYDITYQYGDTGKTQTIYVSELKDTIGTYAKYRFSKEESYPSNLDTVKFSLNKLNGSLKFKMDAFGKKIFDKGNSVFTDETLFGSTFKGLKFTSDDNNSAIIRLDLTYGAGLRIYFHKPGDTAVQYVLLNTTADNANFTEYETSRLAGSILSSLVKYGDKLPLSASSTEMYIQSAAGVAGLVQFPNLQGLKNLGPNILISRVVLEMTPVDNTSLIAHSGLTMYQWDKNNSPVFNSEGYAEFVYNDNSLSSGYQNGNALNNSTFATAYPVASGAWEVNLTTYVREILAGKRANNGIMIVPYSNSITTNRTIIAGPAYPDAGKRIKLKVYYVKA